MSTSYNDRADLPPPHVEEVAENVFGYIQPDGSWWINNTAFVRGATGVLSIDTCSTERRTLAYLDVLQRVGGGVPRTLVNTHHHGDHTNGNYLLPYATIIGHERCRRHMEEAGILRPDGLFEPVEWGSLQLAPPFVTFEHRLNVYADELKVELIHLTSAAHTDNDVVAWIPELRVLVSGDIVFNGGTPFVVMGSVAGSLEALDCVMELEPEVIVPGHGEPCGMGAVDMCGKYLRWLQNSAADTLAAGLSPLDAARELDLGEFASLGDPERLAANLHRAYAECEGARPGAAIDYAAAFADMLAYNGGRPLRCLA